MLTHSIHINREYHDNGQLAYKETIYIIPNDMVGLYDNCRVNVNTGHHWIRIGENVKIKKDGTEAWRLQYDSWGNVIKVGK